MKSKHVIILIAYLVFDQILKIFLINKNIVLLPDLLEIKYVEISGTTMFGFLNSVYFSCFIIMLIAILYYNIRIKKNKKIATPIILIMASALANILDKIIRGYVIDYISIPALGISGINISDVVTILGIILLVFAEVKYLVKKVNNQVKGKRK